MGFVVDGEALVQYLQSCPGNCHHTNTL